MFELEKVGLVGVISLVLCFGCQTELQPVFESEDADDAMSALAREGIDAQKRPRDGGWRLLVPNHQEPKAAQILERKSQPQPEGDSSQWLSSRLLPSPEEGRMLLQSATERRLEDTLERLAGVVDARVHLDLPKRPRITLPGQKAPPARASLLLLVEAGGMKMDIEDVSQLVSGGVPGLSTKDVKIFVESQPAVTPPPASTMVEVGPFLVSPGTESPLRVFIITLMLVLIVASAGLIATLLKLRRLRRREAA
jgi:type III secretion protein J